MRMSQLILGALLLVPAAEAAAQVTVPLTVSGNEAGASIALPGGIGVDLTITFEQVVGLNPGALEVTARLLTPLDAGVLSRLPSGAVAPAAFPVHLQISPTATSALTFQGVVTVGFHTHNLSLRSDMPLSFFSSSQGEAFRDITRYEGIGSYRAGGSSGTFSEFLLVVDTRNLDAVVTGKFTALQGLLDTHDARIDPATATALQARLDQAKAYWQVRNLPAAISEVAAFEAAVRQGSGVAIPDVWRANDSSVVNVAGQLRSAAYTLKFSLQRRTSR
jgi:hypothetical protein